MTFCEIQK